MNLTPIPHVTIAKYENKFFILLKAESKFFFNEIKTFTDNLGEIDILKNKTFDQLVSFKLDECELCYLCDEKIEEGVAKHYLFTHQLITMFSLSNSGSYLTCLNKGGKLRRPLFSKSLPLAYSSHFLDQCSGAQPFIEFLDKIKISKIAVSSIHRIFEINEEELALEQDSVNIDR